MHSAGDPSFPCGTLGAAEQQSQAPSGLLAITYLKMELDTVRARWVEAPMSCARWSRSAMGSWCRLLLLMLVSSGVAAACVRSNTPLALERVLPVLVELVGHQLVERFPDRKSVV